MNHLNLGQEIELKQMIIRVKPIAIIVKLNLKLQFQSRVYVIIVTHTYMLNVIIDRRTFFDQLTKNFLRTNDNIRKFSSDLEDDYTTAFLLD